MQKHEDGSVTFTQEEFEELAQTHEDLLRYPAWKPEHRKFVNMVKWNRILKERKIWIADDQQALLDEWGLEA